MKKICILVVSLLLVLSGCQNSNSKEIKTVDEKGVECYTYMNNDIPIVFGMPSCDNQELLNCSEEESYDLIQTYPDALYYLYNLEHVDDPYAYASKAANLLANKYEDVGTIEISCEHNNYFIIYIKVDGIYYPDDIFSKLINNNNVWMNGFVGNKFDFNNLDDLRSAIKNGFTFMDDNDKVVEVKTTSYNHETIKGPDGTSYKCEERLGTKVYRYCGYQIPVDLGFPELSIEEIKKLVNNPQKDDVASKINTLADAVCYMYYSNFKEGTGEHYKYNGIIFADGQLDYHDEKYYVEYFLSGLEILYTNRGHCCESSILINYLLHDDYKEMGYVRISYPPNEGGHVMLYVLADNGMYYLINPASYINYVNNFEDLWLPFYTKEKGYADNLKDLMNELYHSENGGMPGGHITMLFTLDSNDTYVIGSTTYGNELLAGPNVIENTKLFSIGSNPICWSDNTDYMEYDFKHEHSIDYVLGIKDLKIWEH